jgi:hypothetical protein
MEAFHFKEEYVFVESILRVIGFNKTGSNSNHVFVIHCGSLSARLRGQNSSNWQSSGWAHTICAFTDAQCVLWGTIQFLIGY